MNFGMAVCHEDTHAFLHGEHTTVSGSWMKDQAECRNVLCHTNAALIAENNSHECDYCKAERGRRQLVARDVFDERFLRSEFAEAPAIFPNNDIKYHVGKNRARQWCERKKLEVALVVAEDKPKHRTYQQRPYLKKDKERWLQYHDKNCEKLHGVLALANGLPVMLVDHLDRSPDKQLLSGRVGHVLSWVEDDEEMTQAGERSERTLSHMPKVILVDFHTDAWKMPGMPKAGVYPIFPTKRTWYIDGYRKDKAVLGVERYQFPLAPAFACTAHQAQGSTQEAVIADLLLGRGVSSIASYIAITRVKRRAGLLIYRPFDVAPYQQGIAEGTALLLQVLAGEQVDWASIEDKYVPRKRCGVCKEVRLKEHFTRREFEEKETKCVCLPCMEDCKDVEDNWDAFFCVRCETIRRKEHFQIKESLKNVFFRKAFCNACDKDHKAARKVSDSNKRKQEIAMERMYLCQECQEMKAKKEFSATQLGTTARAPRCQSCCARHEENEIEKASARSATCEHCQKEINGCRLTRDERNNVHDHGRTYMCMDCKQHGRTSKNLMEYTCSRCDMKGGRTQFQKTNLEQDVARNTQQCLECKANTRGGQQCTINSVGNLFLKTNYPQETKELANKGKRSCVKHVRYVVKIHRHARRPREMSRNMSVVDVIIGGTG